MKVFLDTNVLVAASEQNHPHHGPAFRALSRVVNRADRGFISLHSVAETYAALTRLPVRPRIQPAEAARMLTESILPHFQAVPISRKDYLDALKTVVDRGLSGAKIYDALIVGCAARSGAERIYTFNLSDFRDLAPNLADRISAP
ncbi:MAG: type II toxin-antitoxin system VapC family toxin [Candidatus Binatus sp.]